jgi:hypothetical protein
MSHLGFFRHFLGNFLALPQCSSKIFVKDLVNILFPITALKHEFGEQRI